MTNNLSRKGDFFDFFPAIFDELNLSWNPSKLSNHSSNFNADIRETEKDYEVKIDLPGMTKDNIQLDYNRDVLTVSVKREDKTEEKNEEGQIIRSEISYGSMTRQFYLKNVDLEQVTARYENGVLDIHLPKLALENTTRKHIDIN